MIIIREGAMNTAKYPLLFICLLIVSSCKIENSKVSSKTDDVTSNTDLSNTEVIDKSYTLAVNLDKMKDSHFGVREDSDNSCSHQNTITVDSIEDLKVVITTDPLIYDTIILKNGVYDFAKVRIIASASGTSESKMRCLKAESRHGVTIKNEGSFIVLADNFIIDGFIFKDNTEHPITIRSVNVEISNNIFQSSRSGLVIKAFHRSIIRDNLFTDIHGISIMVPQVGLAYYKDYPPIKYVHIYNNSFKDIPRVASNGGEAIHLGYSFSLLPADYDNAINATIENNLFERADGDTEIISVKSDGNTITNNSFVDSQGHLSIRMGYDNIIKYNFFKNVSGGIRISGGDNTISKNVFSLEDEETILMFHNKEKAIVLYNDRVELTYNYLNASKNSINHNIFLVKEMGFKIMPTHPNSDFIVKAEENMVENNLIKITKDSSALDFSLTDGEFKFNDDINEFKKVNDIRQNSFSRNNSFDVTKKVKGELLKESKDTPSWWNKIICSIN